MIIYIAEPLLRGHPDETPTSLKRPYDNVNLNINTLISIPVRGGFDYVLVYI